MTSAGGNVGVGTPNPTALLHVAAPASANPIQALDVDVESFGTMPNALASYFLRIRDIDAGDVRLIVDGTGNVGIGTPSPMCPLDVVSAAGIGGGMRARADNGSSVWLLPSLPNGAWNGITQDGDQGIIFDGGASGLGSGSLVIAPHADAISGIRIAAGGNVGIGTPSPQATLEVAGKTILNGNNLASLDSVDLSFLTNSGKMLIGWNKLPGYGEADFIANRYPGAWGGFAFWDLANDGSVTQLLRLTGDGKVGIGTASPGATLDVQGGPIKATGGLIIETRTSDPASPVTGQIWLRTDL